MEGVPRPIPSTVTPKPILPDAPDGSVWLMLRVFGALILGLAAVSLLVSCGV
jgi:hypothetical protein